MQVWYVKYKHDMNHNIDLNYRRKIRPVEHKLFTHQSLINEIISWIISLQTILYCMIYQVFYSPTNDPTNNRINWIWMSKKIGL